MTTLAPRSAQNAQQTCSLGRPNCKLNHNQATHRMLALHGGNGDHLQALGSPPNPNHHGLVYDRSSNRFQCGLEGCSWSQVHGQDSVADHVVSYARGVRDGTRQIRLTQQFHVHADGRGHQNRLPASDQSQSAAGSASMLPPSLPSQQTVMAPPPKPINQWQAWRKRYRPEKQEFYYGREGPAGAVEQIKKDQNDHKWYLWRGYSTTQQWQNLGEWRTALPEVLPEHADTVS